MKKPKFIIGVWAQPASSFDKWKARGVNTVVQWEPERAYGGAPPRVSKAAWEEEAAGRGLFFATQPGESPERVRAEGLQPFRFAFMQDDEPDLWRPPQVEVEQPPGSGQRVKVPDPRIIQSGKWAGWTDPAVLEARYKLCKDNAPDVPVFTNFAGPSLSNEYYTDAAGHRRYLNSSDVVGHDWYPKNKNAARYPNSHVVLPMRKLALPAFLPAKGGAWPQIVFIECSNQGIAKEGRCPTPDDMQEQVDLAVANGAVGICWFAHSFNIGWPAGWDGVPPENVARMIEINRKLAGEPAPPDPKPEPEPEPAPDPVGRKVDELAVQVAALSKEVAAVKAALEKGFTGTITVGPPK